MRPNIWVHVLLGQYPTRYINHFTITSFSSQWHQVTQPIKFEQSHTCCNKGKIKYLWWMSNDGAFGKTLSLPTVTGHGETEGSQCIMWVSEKPKGDVLCMARCIQCQCAGMVTLGGATHADHKSMRKQFWLCSFNVLVGFYCSVLQRFAKTVICC